MSHPVSIVTTIRIDAPRELVWDVLTDIGLQPVWMRDALDVTLEDGPAEGMVGSRMRVPTRIGPFRTTDVMQTTAYDAPVRWEVSHLDRFSGSGEFVLRDDAGRTLVIWTETLTAPLGAAGRFGLGVMAPVLKRTFAGDLDRLRRICEARVLRHLNAFDATGDAALTPPTQPTSA